jgi:SAM-dependent methyltransferase
MLSPEVAAYYECGEEQARLTARTGRLEWARTWELLGRHLPAAPATVLDVGGGPGAYAVPLALAGYAVHLVDAMPLHVDQALAAAANAEVGLASAAVGDARSLDFPDGSADAVLLLGPLYHLIEPAERAAALAEARRVLRPGGVLAAATISRFSALIESLRHGWGADHAEIVDSALTDGVHRNPEGLTRFFTTAHFARPAEIAVEVAAAGFTDVRGLAVEGPGTLVPDVDAWLDDPRRRDWLLRQIRRVETEPELLGASPHVLTVGRG